MAMELESLWSVKTNVQTYTKSTHVLKTIRVKPLTFVRVQAYSVC